MNPEQAKDIIEKLIEEHGPDCRETGHRLVIRDGKPLLVDKVTEKPDDIKVCDVGKGGMRRGFTAGLWNDMGELLSEAVNKAAGKG